MARKGEGMLQLVEMEGRVTENGCIEIPMTVLDQAGICTGDAIKLIYMAEEEEVKSAAKEFLLVKNDQDVVEELAREQRVSLQIPEELLQDAGIPMDADLDIVCQNGRIVIFSSELLKETVIPEEVMEICNELGISEDKVKIILNTTEGEPDEKTGT
ncbi:MAG: hypothetical protein ACLTRK_03670 [Waltera sp.]|jgi:hypothetical protein